MIENAGALKRFGGQAVAHLIMAWVVTLPVAGTLAAGVLLFLQS